jgi:hypothetical protein
MEAIPIFGMITGVIITLGFFSAVVLTVHYFVKARNKEKMALIEKGVDISEIYSSKEKTNSTLKYGMFLVGIAIGLFLGNLLGNYTSINMVISYITMTLLFGGASLILFHWYNSKQESA